MLLRFILNDATIAADLPPGMVLLDYIRYHRYLMGTKIGCREGDCGACTVLVGELKDDRLQYQSMTSCLLPLGNVQGKHIVSIEGINLPGLNPVQQAMADEGATQCGFCTPGFVMSLAGFCLDSREPGPELAIAAIDGNICRCTGYKSIERAALRIVSLLKQRKKDEEPAFFVAEKKILPAYFAGIKERLKLLASPTEKINVSPEIQGEKRLVGGGTDLYVQQHEEMTEAPAQYLFDQPGMKEIRREGNKLLIGPSVTVSELAASAIFLEAFPVFNEYVKLISSTPIRNMATVAGNFINASPIGDLTIFFLALDAKLQLSDGNRSRELPLRQLYKGYKQLDKKPGEFIKMIWLPWPGINTRFHFEKVSKRTHLDIASVNSAICLHIEAGIIEKASLSAGGVGPVPMFLSKTSAFLEGKKISEELVREAIAVMRTEISPISDARGSREYKTLLLEQLIKAHCLRLFPQLQAKKLVLPQPPGA